jgi:O-methyltransferase involved in polyketide biosynthesis
MSDSRISPTAAYTGQTWVENGLSPRNFGSRLGRAMYLSTVPAQAVMRRAGVATLHGMLLARHNAIDAIVMQEIAEGRVSAVIELACGMSGRGLRFTREFPDLPYIETDLPGMVERKQRALLEVGPLSDHHQVRVLDAFSSHGLFNLVEELKAKHPALAGPKMEPTSEPSERGIAIVAEGLQNYFDETTVRALWRRVVPLLGSGIFVGDLHTRETNSGWLVAAYEASLSAFVRGKVHIHFADRVAALEAMREEGGIGDLQHPSDICDVAELASAKRVWIAQLRSSSRE